MKIAFDIGANIGKWTNSNIDNFDKIISIEASPTTFESLKINCNSDKVILVNYAVCNNNEKDIIFYEAESNTLSTINKDWLTDKKSRFCNSLYKEIICKTTTIDLLIENHGKPDLIKIDVEGGEYYCISSLTQKVNLLCFEWASETSDITFKCIDYLSILGYDKFFIQEKDEYTFRPSEHNYYDIAHAKNIISKSIPKVNWGMVWCK
jgi:FkbM family methyltransferase